MMQKTQYGVIRLSGFVLQGLILAYSVYLELHDFHTIRWVWFAYLTHLNLILAFVYELCAGSAFVMSPVVNNERFPVLRDTAVTMSLGVTVLYWTIDRSSTLFDGILFHGVNTFLLLTEVALLKQSYVPRLWSLRYVMPISVSIVYIVSEALLTLHGMVNSQGQPLYHALPWKTDFQAALTWSVVGMVLVALIPLAVRFLYKSKPIYRIGLYLISAFCIISILIIANNNEASSMFSQSKSVENQIDELAKLSTNPYTASLPLLASAELQDDKRYQAARKQMLAFLSDDPEHFPEWMRSHSFNAWMQGRVLSAADQMNDKDGALQANRELTALLEQKATDKDSSAFFAWAWGYRAAHNQEEYAASKKKMMSEAALLVAKYQSSESHDDLSNAMWAWVMNIAASANANDQETYDEIKKQMMLLTGAKSVPESLEKALLRTASSNDYPAWALAKVRSAAVMMNDEGLLRAIDPVLTDSIKGAKKADQTAEYVLAVLDKPVMPQKVNSVMPAR